MPRIGNQFELLVIDEAHHLCAGTVGELLDLSIAGARLGLTATPPREDQPVTNLVRRIGPVCYQLSIGELAGTFLAPFDLVQFRLDLNDSERRRYQTEMEAFRGVFARFRAAYPAGTWSDFVRAASRSNEGRRALAASREAKRCLAYTNAKKRALSWLLRRHRGARMLVFTANNESAYTISKEFLIMPITAAIGRKEREQALGQFAKGELSVLVSTRVLNEGIDVPQAEIAIIVGGSLGEREQVQRVGRLLRPAAGKRSIVYELITRATTEIGQAHRRSAGIAPRVSAQL
jgi:superfamily II DNA or RNA helicase